MRTHTAAGTLFLFALALTACSTATADSATPATTAPSSGSTAPSAATPALVTSPGGLVEPGSSTRVGFRGPGRGTVSFRDASDRVVAIADIDPTWGFTVTAPAGTYKAHHGAGCEGEVTIADGAQVLLPCEAPANQGEAMPPVGTGTGTLHGQVRLTASMNFEGTAPEPGTITVKDAAGKAQGSAPLRADGTFEITLPAGEYTLTSDSPSLTGTAASGADPWVCPFTDVTIYTDIVRSARFNCVPTPTS